MLCWDKGVGRCPRYVCCKTDYESIVYCVTRRHTHRRRRACGRPGGRSACRGRYVKEKDGSSAIEQSISPTEADGRMHGPRFLCPMHDSPAGGAGVVDGGPPACCRRCLSRAGQQQPGHHEVHQHATSCVASVVHSRRWLPAQPVDRLMPRLPGCYVCVVCVMAGVESVECVRTSNVAHQISRLVKKCRAQTKTCC